MKGQITEIHHKIVRALGGKCASCGWGEDPRILQVLYSQEAREEYAKRNRTSFYLHVLADLADNAAAYKLICPNCKGMLMLERRAEKLNAQIVEELTTRRVVWRTSLTAREAFEAKFDWVEKFVQDRLEVLVVPSDGKVYRYKHPTPLAEGWGEYAAQTGLPVELGSKAVVMLG